MLEQLLQYDTDLFLYLNNLGSEPYDGIWLFISNKFSSIPLYLILLYLIFRELSWKGTMFVLVAVALMIACSDQLANLFKYVLFQRPRPCRVEAIQDQMRFVANTCGRYGYFSAHAASSMALAVFIGLFLKHRYTYLPYLMLFWASIIAFSRIYLGVHYPLDIFTGMIFGGLIGYAFYRITRNVLEKYQA